MNNLEIQTAELAKNELIQNFGSNDSYSLYKEIISDPF